MLVEQIQGIAGHLAISALKKCLRIHELPKHILAGVDIKEPVMGTSTFDGQDRLGRFVAIESASLIELRLTDNDPSHRLPSRRFTFSLIPLSHA